LALGAIKRVGHQWNPQRKCDAKDTDVWITEPAKPPLEAFDHKPERSNEQEVTDESGSLPAAAMSLSLNSNRRANDTAGDSSGSDRKHNTSDCSEPNPRIFEITHFVLVAD
jgi:hypothetical protein